MKNEEAYERAKEELMEENVVAMYDVRGIQKYIYKTAKVKDAIGASDLVEGIIDEALQKAVQMCGLSEEQTDLFWKEAVDEPGCEKGKRKKYVPKEYQEDDKKKVQVLFIGGGNGFVLFSDIELCNRVNRYMARYILEETYSLQLAVAVVKKTDHYASDYKNLHLEMNKIKADMSDSKPLGALPVMQIEIKTGYPAVDQDGTSSETKKKKERKDRIRIKEGEEKYLENIITQKGVDSNLAVVHLDGNNMGLRIREIISGKDSYQDAVNTMRQISYRIDQSYKQVFQNMKEQFSSEHIVIEGKETKPYMRKIVTAGDDITYVCNAQIAFATVEYFCKKITNYTLYQEKEDMTPEEEKENKKKYGFSVCAGIAFMNSHFPFEIAYDTAEECCDSAKDAAKDSQNMDGERIGNYFDFQICKNIAVRNLDLVRKKEYQTPLGEHLLYRPYFVETDNDFGLRACNHCPTYGELTRSILYFQGKTGKKAFPRSFAKQLRNTYPLGINAITTFIGFLHSRGWEMPDNDQNMYVDVDGVTVARWYDALEMLDYYMDVQLRKEDEADE